ncbi:MAG TPA: hypothetical protein VK673_04855 [Chthoniobacterales bacterium]|nr:hypothetical protein [Chthoniobacterales bacterium]
MQKYTTYREPTTVERRERRERKWWEQPHCRDEGIDVAPFLEHSVSLSINPFPALLAFSRTFLPLPQWTEDVTFL